MTTDEMNQEERRFSELLGAANVGLPPCDPQFMKRVKQQTTDAYLAEATARAEPQRSIVMKVFKRLIPIAAAACVLVTVGVMILTDMSGTSVAWGQTAQKMAQAQAMAFDTEVGGENARMYIKGRSHIRLEVARTPVAGAVTKTASDQTVPLWDVTIWDLDNGRMIMLDMARRHSAATTIAGKNQTIPGPDALLQALSSLPEKNTRQAEQGEIAGEPVTRFDTVINETMRNALNIDREWTGSVSVWVSKKTALPVQVEYAVPLLDHKGVCIGAAMQRVTNIRWNEPLSDDLFEPPAGFTTTQWPVADPDGKRSVDRVKSAANLNELGRACRQYAKEHDGNWPVNLDDLGAPTLRQSGYAYIRPRKPSATPPDKIVMYEWYETWEDGVNVLQFDGQVKFVSDEATLKKILAGSSTSATIQNGRPSSQPG